MGYTVLAALVGVLFYPVISPIRFPYHVIPQVAMAALGVTYLVIQILPRRHQPTRLIVAVLVLSFLFFGAAAKPLSFKRSDPGQRPMAFRQPGGCFAPARCRLCPRWVISRLTPGPTIGP